MSKSIIRYISETMNNCLDQDEQSIRTCVAMDATITKALEEHEAKKNSFSNEKEHNITVTVDEIKRDMMRPMIDDQQIADIENYASEELEIESRTSEHDREER